MGREDIGPREEIVTEQKKRARHTKKSRSKRRRGDQILSHVVSLRLNDDELTLLARIRNETSKSTSEIMREVFARAATLMFPESEQGVVA